MEKQKRQFPNLIKKFKDPSFKIAAKGKWYLIAPGLLILVGLIIFLTIGFNLGLDFTGGNTVRVRSTITDINYGELENRVTTTVREVVGSGGTVRSWQEDTGGVVSISVQFYASGIDLEELGTQVEERLRTYLGEDFEVENIGFISAAASAEHIQTAFMALMAVLAIILFYMLFRFKFTSGVSAVIGLFHDVVVMLALVLIFRVQVNASFIAALITVVAYSINNTLVLFDRVRGIEKINNKKETTETIVDRSVKETFTRTMNTTVTTLVPIFVLIICGAILNVPLLTEFAVPIFFGLLAGTFSTIFLTTSLYVRFENAKKWSARRKKQKQIAQV